MKFWKDPIFVSFLLLSITGGVVIWGLNFTRNLSQDTRSKAESTNSNRKIYQIAYVDSFDNSGKNSWISLFNTYATENDGIIFHGEDLIEQQGNLTYCNTANFAIFTKDVEAVPDGKIIVSFPSYETAQAIIDNGCNWAKISDSFFYALEMSNKSKLEYKDPGNSSQNASSFAERYNLEYIASPNKSITKSYASYIAKYADAYNFQATSNSQWNWSTWNSWYLKCYLTDETQGYKCPTEGGGPFDSINVASNACSNPESLKIFITIDANLGYGSKELLDTSEEIENTTAISDDFEGYVVTGLNSLSQYETIKAFINTLRET